MTDGKLLESETLLLGAALIDADTARALLGKLKPDDFALEIDREIFAAMGRIDGRGEAIDPVKVLHEAGAEREYLMGLMDIVPGAVDMESHVAAVREAAARRRVRETLENASAMLDEGAAAGDVMDTVARSFDEIGKAGDGELISGEDAALEFWDRLDAGGGFAVQTGFSDLDRVLGGGMLGCGLYVLAARPGCGKTALALQVADNVAKGGAVLFISLEMDSVQLTARRVSRLCRIPASRMLLGGATDDEIAEASRAGRRLVHVPLYLNRRLRCSVGEIRTLARKVKGLRLVVIDYLQLIRLNPRLKSRYEQITEVSGELKILARTLGVPVLCLAQLNRASETRADKKPILADLRDSGAIEQDADAVIFLHRPDMYDDEEEKSERVQVKVNVAKNRHAGTGEIDMQMELTSGNFSEAEWRYG